MGGIELAIKAAPHVKEVITKAKDFISALAKHGVITTHQQNACDARVDLVCDAALSGKEPEAWLVEPDPE